MMNVLCFCSNSCRVETVTGYLGSYVMTSKDEPLAMGPAVVVCGGVLVGGGALVLSSADSGLGILAAASKSCG